jgi:hypothetical protein
LSQALNLPLFIIFSFPSHLLRSRLTNRYSALPWLKPVVGRLMALMARSSIAPSQITSRLTFPVSGDS